MNHKEICEAESLKNKIKLSHQCKTENGIEPDEEFIITEIIGNYEQVVVTNQYNRKIIINPNQIEKFMSFEHENPELVGQEEFYDNLNNQEQQPKTEWTTEELTQDFEVLGFGGGFCAVKRKSDGQKGSLDFNGRPRTYFNFIKHNK